MQHKEGDNRPQNPAIPAQWKIPHPLSEFAQISVRRNDNFLHVDIPPHREAIVERDGKTFFFVTNNKEEDYFFRDSGEVTASREINQDGIDIHLMTDVSTLYHFRREEDTGPIGKSHGLSTSFDVELRDLPQTGTHYLASLHYDGPFLDTIELPDSFVDTPAQEVESPDLTIGIHYGQSAQDLHGEIPNEERERFAAYYANTGWKFEEPVNGAEEAFLVENGVRAFRVSWRLENRRAIIEKEYIKQTFDGQTIKYVVNAPLLVNTNALLEIACAPSVDEQTQELHASWRYINEPADNPFVIIKGPLQEYYSSGGDRETQR